MKESGREMAFFHPSSLILHPSFRRRDLRLVRYLVTALALLPLPVRAQNQPPVAFEGLPGIQSLAFNPQGALFASIPEKAGAIAQVLGPKLSQTLAETGGKPAGLAIDGHGTLYVADPQRKAILRVRPWGEPTVAADRCGGKPLIAPLDVAVSGQNVYFVDAGSSTICDLAGRVISDRIPEPTAMAVNSVTGLLMVADKTGGLWQVAQDGTPRRFASLGSRISGLEIDGEGNIYVAGEAGLGVVDPFGRTLRTDQFGSPVSDVAFGMADRSALFVAVPRSGTVYRLRALGPSQPDAWTAVRALRITEPVDGEILNRHDGILTAAGLRIRVSGEFSGQGPVTVNGIRAESAENRFQADIVINDRKNRILAQGGQDASDQVTVLWDKDSFPRYRVSIDDNIHWLKDIALHDPPYRSIFENPFLAFWREMHEKYGARVHFNIYYETAGFNLSQMPDRYRKEWQENVPWVRLTFHARSNNPDRPYLHSSADRIREDYRLVKREIERFAGKELLSDVTTIHWGEATSAAMQALRAEGLKTFVGYFELRRELPAVSYDVTMPQLLHLTRRDYWKDVERDILFVRHDMVINGVPLEQVVPRLEKLAVDPHQSEVIELMIHEQFWYPDYVAYLPDYKERVERAIQWVTQRGYAPVFFGDGFLGARLKP